MLRNPYYRQHSAVSNAGLSLRAEQFNHLKSTNKCFALSVSLSGTASALGTLGAIAAFYLYMKKYTIIFVLILLLPATLQSTNIKIDKINNYFKHKYWRVNSKFVNGIRRGAFGEIDFLIPTIKFDGDNSLGRKLYSISLDRILLVNDAVTNAENLVLASCTPEILLLDTFENGSFKINYHDLEFRKEMIMNFDGDSILISSLQEDTSFHFSMVLTKMYLPEKYKLMMTDYDNGK